MPADKGSLQDSENCDDSRSSEPEMVEARSGITVEVPLWAAGWKKQ